MLVTKSVYFVVVKLNPHVESEKKKKCSEGKLDRSRSVPVSPRSPKPKTMLVSCLAQARQHNWPLHHVQWEPFHNFLTKTRQDVDPHLKWTFGLEFCTQLIPTTEMDCRVRLKWVYPCLYCRKLCGRECWNVEFSWTRGGVGMRAVSVSAQSWPIWDVDNHIWNLVRDPQMCIHISWWLSYRCEC
jgi:hypothetical protein